MIIENLEKLCEITWFILKGETSYVEKLCDTVIWKSCYKSLKYVMRKLCTYYIYF